MGGPDFRTTCDIFTTWFSTYRQNDAMKRPHMFLRWVAKCHQLESFLTLGVEKRTFGSTPQPRVQSWQMKVLFFGMPGWPKNDMSSWWWLFLGRETTQEMLSEPITFLTAFHLTKRSLTFQWSSRKNVFFFWSFEMSLLYHPDESSSSLSANSYFFHKLWCIFG